MKYSITILIKFKRIFDLWLLYKEEYGFSIALGFTGAVICVYVITLFAFRWAKLPYPPPSRLSRAGLINLRLCGHRLMIRSFSIELGFTGMAVRIYFRVIPCFYDLFIFGVFSSYPVIRFAKDFIKNPIRPLLVNSTPCGYCPEQKTDEKIEKLYFRTVTI